jgi:PD-(D/E)XK nuclease superfamily
MSFMEVDWKEFDELTSWEILDKIVKIEESTLFEIAGFPHYETVISNFYNYYFDLSQSHGFEDLFITSLLNIINQKSKDSFTFNIKSYTSLREVRTNKNNLIDIVLIEGEVNEKFPSDTQYESAIIIENKMFASLYNDLNDYYSSIKSTNKIGVVLSIKPIFISHKNFVCITHKELIDEITNQSITYFLDVSERQIAIFKDFIKNLQSYYNNNKTNLEMDKHIDFFFKNGSKVKRLMDEYDNLFVFLNKAISQVVDDLQFDSKTSKGSGAKRTSVFEIKNTSLSWWVYLDKIVSEKTFKIDFWIQQDNEAIMKWKSIEENDLANFKRIAEDVNINLTITKIGDKSTWRKIGGKEYSVNMNDLSNFKDYFKNVIENDWMLLKNEVVKLQSNL